MLVDEMPEWGGARTEGAQRHPRLDPPLCRGCRCLYGAGRRCRGEGDNAGRGYVFGATATARSKIRLAIAVGRDPRQG